MFYVLKRSKIIFTILCIVFILFQKSNLIAFPGDHNSLTCDKNFIGLTVNVYDKNTQAFVDKVIQDDIKDSAGNLTGILADYYRKRPDQLIDDNLRKSRANIITAINADIAKEFSQSIVKQNIRSRNISNDNGRTIHVTKWGDSLSDLVQVYGVMGPAYPSYETYKNQGIWGGGIGPIDSWDDYFSVFGSPSNQNVVFVQNYAVSTYTTDGVLRLMGVNLDNSIDSNWWDSRITDNHCIMEGSVPYFFNLRPGHEFSGKSALRSSLLVSGNDVFHEIGKLTVLFPFLGSHVVDHIVDNITMITDWHIENGKKILLEGAIPGLAGTIKPYNSAVVSRKALCRPFDETFIPPQKIPWWLCALGPGICAQAFKATQEYYKIIEKEFRTFGINLIEHKPESNNHLTPQGFLNNPIGAIGSASNVVDMAGDDIVNGIMDGLRMTAAHPPDGGESKYNHPLMRMVSIIQACVNDRIEQDIGPSYAQNYPNNVDYLPLYNHFNITGNNESAPFFWVPKPGLYRKFMGKLSAGQSHDLGFIVPDIIHIGPAGYQLWGTIEGEWLKRKEWNRIPIETDYPEPVINLDNDGPGKKIKRKALALNWHGKDTSQTQKIQNRETGGVNGVGSFGGYFRTYRDGVIFLQQNNDLVGGTSETKFGEPFSVSGTLLARYLQEGGPAGKLGFPITDPFQIYFNSIDTINFQCGRIDHNIMNVLDLANADVHITSTACENQ